ncbi:MAG: hypothetical protein LBG69_03460 [Zoogloeaceae bacterium]|jgi:hypothetical protein|nr:hypothetical protein [Zoogloeaceae bacterium]
MLFIVASIPGRIRIRHEFFTHLRHSEDWRAALLALNGVLRVESRLAAASLIVRYDPAAVSVKDMENAVRGLARAKLKPAPEPLSVHAATGRKTYRAIHRSVKYCMLLSLAATIALARRDTRKAHAVAGWLFAASVSAHLFLYRKRLFA